MFLGTNVREQLKVKLPKSLYLGFFPNKIHICTCMEFQGFIFFFFLFFAVPLYGALLGCT